MKQREAIIQNYIDAYNSFDVEGMIKDMDDNVMFQNVSNGDTNISLQGIDAFKAQAEQAKIYFTERKQTLTSVTHSLDTTEIEIDYHAVLAIDFPNGMKKGEVLKMQGISLFTFKGDKIIKLVDVS